MNSVPDHEERIRRIGGDLWERIQGERPRIFNRQYWQGQVLEWAMADQQFKVDLFRLIDVLPCLHTTEQVTTHIREYLLKKDGRLPKSLQTLLNLATGLGSGLAVKAFRKNVEDMARQFIAGRDARSALPVFQKLYEDNIGFTADLLGEATHSHDEAQAYGDRYLELLRAVSEAVALWPERETLERDDLGPIPRANVSVKISALSPHIDPVDLAGSVARVKERLLPILYEAKNANVFINFDLEKWSLHDITYTLFEDIVSDGELRDWPHVGIVVQGYLKSATQDLERLLTLARNRGTPLTVRLVKGAYWDYEIVRVRQHGYPCPVFADKTKTDSNYETLSETLLRNREWLRPAFGTHNLRSIANVMALEERMGVPRRAFEFQALYGMMEPERKALQELGYRVRVYAPIGQLLPGMAYLVRRLLENTANEGFIRQTHRENIDLDVLLEKPSQAETPPATPKMISGNPETPFENASLADFTSDTVRERFRAALQQNVASFPISVPVVIGGASQTTSSTFDRVDPGETSRVVAHVSLASPGDTRHSIELAMNAWPKWRDTPLVERARLADRAGDLLERDRFELASLQCYEAGKPWRDADADIVEAIDFCRYYARRALAELSPARQGRTAGEENTLIYEGRGPTVVIAPWNFPAAILCGMTVAALVAGNPVLMKPAEQTSAVGYRLYQRLIEAGFPCDVVHFVPGIGEEIGPVLVNHPLTAQIAFTGSKEVGLAILEDAAKVRPNQRLLKRVVCEMGGKNAIIVDRDADFDAAVEGVIQSGFGFAGQKCSACSRVILVGDAFDPFTRRLVNAAKSLHIAHAADPASQLPAVVDDDACQRLKSVIADPGDGALQIYVGEAPDGGYYVPPAIYEVAGRSHPLMQRELFGPVLALHPVADFDEALEAANDTDFALTGGVYSRKPSHLEQAAKEFRVGNLYLNRPITGATVGRQPFGGSALSGGGAKAGGPGYLVHFAAPRTLTENTMRQGFSPDVST